MRRFRLSTLMLLIAIVAGGLALVVQYRRAARREAESKARITRLWKYRPLKAEMSSRLRRSEAATGAMAGIRADRLPDDSGPRFRDGNRDTFEAPGAGFELRLEESRKPTRPGRPP